MLNGCRVYAIIDCQATRVYYDKHPRDRTMSKSEIGSNSRIDVAGWRKSGWTASLLDDGTVSRQIFWMEQRHAAEFNLPREPQPRRKRRYYKCRYLSCPREISLLRNIVCFRISGVFFFLTSALATKISRASKGNENRL